jgi:sirohydrochlorin cobaltochelatase
MRQGLILFAHGARDPRWAQPFEDVAARVRAQRPADPVLLAYLEFMAPDLDAAGDALVQAGCQRVDVLPLFLGAGGHVRKDLPERLQRLRERHAGTQWVLRPAAGESPRLVDTLAGIALDALAQPAPRQEPS